jgi:hypothetical protein
MLLTMSALRGTSDLPRTYCEMARAPAGMDLVVEQEAAIRVAGMTEAKAATAKGVTVKVAKGVMVRAATVKVAKEEMTTS